MKRILFILLLFPFMIKAQKVETAPVKSPVVATSVEKQPEFNGGIAAWRKFIQNNLDASRAAELQDSVTFAKYGIRQMAIVRFTVCDDGSLCDFEIVNKNKVSPAVANEALKVMKKSPKWVPAQNNGVNVRALFQQPIVFYFGN